MTAPDLKLIAASCARIGTHFAAIAAELEVLEDHVGLSGIELPLLSGSEQSHDVDAPKSRRRMIPTKRTADDFLAISEIVALLNVDARAFRRLRRDLSAKFPAPHSFGRSLRWKGSEVRGWIERQRSRA